MLQRIRDNATGPITYGVVALISLVFGVWGIGSYFTQSADPVVAKAGSVKITKYQLQQAYNNRYRMMHNRQGENFDYDSFDPSTFRHKVLQSLIQNALLSQYAQDAGYRTTDQMLLSYLQSDPRFQTGGKFSQSRYKALLQAGGLSPSMFESQKRGDLQVQQVRRGLLSTVFATSREVALDYQLQHQSRKAAYLVFDPAREQSSRVKVSDKAVKAYYQAHTADFMTPERAKLAYISVARDKMQIDKPDAETLRALYAQQKEAHFKIPGRRKARDILVRVNGDKDAGKARQRIQMLAKKLAQGGDFAELARKYSDDKKTAASGGEMGWIERGTKGNAFEKALFSLDKGATSSPVRTQQGWYLIQLQAAQPASYKPFDNSKVQAKLVADYQSRQRREQFRKLSQKLENLSFEIPESLKPIADKLGLQVEQTGWIDQGSQPESGLGQYDAVRKAAFSDAVVKDKLNSEPIKLGDDRVVVLRISKHQKAAPKPLQTVRSQVVKTVRQTEADQLAEKKAQAALDALNSGKTLTQVAAQSNAKKVEAGWLTRDSSEQPDGLLDALFAMPEPQKDKPNYQIATLSDGRIAVLQLAGVKSTSADSADSQTRAALKRSANARIAGMEYAALLQNLRNNYKVKIYKDKIN